MLKISQAIVVEGKYDLNALSQIVDAPIFTTDGFHVMKDKQLLNLLRRVAQERGLIILTDSDGAGFVIRNYLTGALPKDKVYHAYIPEISGKERRKAQAGKEGLLGVEGMRPEVILSALERAGVPLDGQVGVNSDPITKADLVLCGLSGGDGSAEKRKKLLKELDFPEKMSANAMLRALNLLFDREAFLRKYSND
ncbi:MAG: DUF4093 domain-containing protein [Ruminococcaceae bacterium]|nr:DUF4093 domain-containing protein [Oscillospiraceae bacterium]